MTKFFDWETEFDKAGSIRISCGSKEFKDFKDKMSKIFKYEIYLSSNLYIWFPNNNDPQNIIFNWAEENLEDRWSFIFSKEYIHIFFKSEQDVLRFTFKWGGQK